MRCAVHRRPPPGRLRLVALAAQRATISLTIMVARPGVLSTTRLCLQAWFALYLESFQALLPASWADLDLVSGRVLIF